MDGRLLSLEKRIGSLEVKGCGGKSADEIRRQIGSVPGNVEEHCKEVGLAHRFYRVGGEYYERPLKYRKSVLGAVSIGQLCKSVLVKNTARDASVGCRENSEYFLIVVQYCEKLDSDKLWRAVHRLLPEDKRLAKGSYSFRLATQEESDSVCGFVHNAVSPLGMKDRSVPLIVCKSIRKLNPPVIYLGGGEVDLKLQVNVDQFCKLMNAFVLDISVPRGEGEMDSCDSQAPFSVPMHATSSAPVPAAQSGAVPKNIREAYDALDLRVGEIVAACAHPDSEKLLVETIDVGDKKPDGSDEGPRQILSGIAKFYDPNDLVGRKIVVLCNLKPAKLGGIASCGMVMCAKNENELVVVEVSEDVPVGTRISLSSETQGTPASSTQMKKKKLLEKILPELQLNGEHQAAFKGFPLLADGKYCLGTGVSLPAMVA
uniref:tRNA-binding domain-containing protein n=1 Tax=Mucochytrium quahogii TaxID=96639 RepID=A0A7S2S4F4_9STRA|mmetsp:Transcript_6922/g.10954  ORF Transcript_6922/g.10954 Transcript_6922/m.10954 type:complete len:429 (+) Transcript_6922:244-1530(+)|eukprot:CAMPEP_0203751782 /NCGR_PEP_ID=MMETSP0098-20131031/5799_1 /ASSEMBLY_ACC=CAM_ASM_000208 /TAXON_ID=96639 /ORGANISM=" , Strain NY0313808BC1" /LENGTH=428 /DNA_ID=CAMNT_0050641667 /DNA_START=286 /DNA_END=1572 /DNA_ORIENTATION=-